MKGIGPYVNKILHRGIQMRGAWFLLLLVTCTLVSTLQHALAMLEVATAGRQTANVVSVASQQNTSSVVADAATFIFLKSRIRP